MADPTESSRRVLDPIERISEILFGLIMVLTFTGSLSVAEAGRADVREMLVGALGCNIAWGVIDGVFYLMGSLADRARNVMTMLELRRSTDPAAGRALVAGALPPLVASVLKPAELESIGDRLKALPEPPKKARFNLEHWKGALGVFLLVFLTTFPVVIPFFFVSDIKLAMRISNAIAIVMLFLAGHKFGTMTGRSPVGTALFMVVFGLILVSATIALGG